MIKTAGSRVPGRGPVQPVPALECGSYSSLSGTKKMPRSPHAAAIIRPQKPASRAAALFAYPNRRIFRASLVQKFQDIVILCPKKGALQI